MKDNVLNSPLQNVFIWILVAIAPIVAIIQASHVIPGIDSFGPTILVVISTIFVVTHGLHRYGWRNFLVFFLIVFLIGNFYENLSIATTFPFGPYHYSDSLGPKFIFTPLVINLAYFQMAYLVWNLSGVVLGDVRNSPKAKNIFFQPVVGMFIMVMWDLSMDPYMSTLSNHWIWHKGGEYFGVPVQNYYGWYLTIFTMLQLFSFYMSRQPNAQTPNFIFTKKNWVQVTIVYLTWVLNYVLLGLFEINRTVTALNGTAWHSKDILQSGGLIAVGTMLFIAVLVLIKTIGSDELGTLEKRSRS